MKKNMFLTFLQKRLKRVTSREYDTVARADNYFAEYRMLFLRHRGNEHDIEEEMFHLNDLSDQI
jgi:hypothetical protein